jgi:hypothetical protein
MYKYLVMLPLCLLLAPQQREVIVAAIPLAPPSDGQEPLPTGDELAFLEKCDQHYDESGIRGYRALMHKQERIGQKLMPSEEVDVWYREKPRSIFMKWLKGERRAAAILYVEGENNGMMLVHPSGIAGKLAPVVSRDPEGADAKDGGRYSVKQAGLRPTLMRTLNDWKAAKQRGTLQVKYLGIRKVVEADNHDCYTLQRKTEPGQNNGIQEVTLYIDKETLLQVRTVLKGPENILLGDYVYKDIQINPQFKPNQFDRSALTE